MSLCVNIIITLHYVTFRYFTLCLCYVTLHYFMLCLRYVTVRYITLCYVTLCHYVTGSLTGNAAAIMEEDPKALVTVGSWSEITHYITLCLRYVTCNVTLHYITLHYVITLQVHQPAGSGHQGGGSQGSGHHRLVV